jgi:hypothetical protein
VRGGRGHKEGKETHLGSHELGRSTKGRGRLAVPHVLLAETVVSDLDVTLDGKQDVVELEISAAYRSNPNLLSAIVYPEWTLQDRLLRGKEESTNR